MSYISLKHFVDLYSKDKDLYFGGQNGRQLNDIVAYRRLSQLSLTRIVI